MEQENYDLVLTAHHGDDQLETLLMRLTRGGSFTGHSGIVRQQTFGNGILLRPLLSFSKETLYEYAEEKNLTYLKMLRIFHKTTFEIESVKISYQS